MSHKHIKHIMLDIETLATTNDAAILSIGGCIFSLDKDAPLAGSQKGDSFLVSVDAEYYERFGRDYNVCSRTKAWWEQQGQEAKDALSINLAHSPKEALDKMDEFFRYHDFTASFEVEADRVWANPPQFDVTILRHAASVERTSPDDLPWTFKQETCMRSAFWLGRKRLPKRDPELLRHRADHDAIAQARALQELYQRVKG